MALIKCNECGHVVSDKADFCPHCGSPKETASICEECGTQIPINAFECPKCGCPIGQHVENKVKVEKPKKKNGWKWGFVMVLSCLVGAGGFFAYTKLFKSEWKSPDGKTEQEIIRIGYNTGYEWGSEFGVYMYEGNSYEDLKRAAKNEYFGEIVTSEDNRVWKKFSDELFKGMQQGIREKEGYYK